GDGNREQASLLSAPVEDRARPSGLQLVPGQQRWRLRTGDHSSVCRYQLLERGRTARESHTRGSGEGLSEVGRPTAKACVDAAVEARLRSQVETGADEAEKHRRGKAGDESESYADRQALLQGTRR